MHSANSRFGIGSLLTIVGAILLIVALPLTWYHADRTFHSELTGWAIFTHLRFWLIGAAALALPMAALPRGREVVIPRAALGVLAGGPVVRRIIEPPGHGVALHDRAGLWVALAGAVALILGGLLSAGRRVAEHYQWDLPGTGTLRALPAPQPHVANGSGAVYPPLVDGDVVP